MMMVIVRNKWVQEQCDISAVMRTAKKSRGKSHAFPLHNSLICLLHSLQWMAAWPEELALDTLCVRMPTVGTNTQWQLHSTLHFGLPRHVAELSPVASSIDAL